MLETQCLTAQDYVSLCEPVASIKKGAVGEMTQQLKALAGLAEDWSLFPNIYMVAHSSL